MADDALHSRAVHLRARGLGHSFPGRRLFRDLSFEVPAGRILHIKGPNGIGKSTLVSICLNRLRPRQGSVEFLIAKERVAYLPQMLNPRFALPLLLEDVIDCLLGRRVSADAVAAAGLLQPSQLRLDWESASGGERVRTLMTSVLLQTPKMLLLDEPFNHLDEQGAASLGEAIEAYLLRESASLLLVSHLLPASWRRANAPVDTLELERYCKEYGKEQTHVR